MQETYGIIASQAAEDPDWITEMSAQGFILLLKDKRVRYNPLERVALCRAHARAFALASGSLTGQQMADYYERNLTEILLIADNVAGPYFYHVYAERVRRMDLDC